MRSAPTCAPNTPPGSSGARRLGPRPTSTTRRPAAPAVAAGPTRSAGSAKSGSPPTHPHPPPPPPETTTATRSARCGPNQPRPHQRHSIRCSKRVVDQEYGNLSGWSGPDIGTQAGDPPASGRLPIDVDSTRSPIASPFLNSDMAHMLVPHGAHHLVCLTTR
jgi:hypothetical protein